MEHQYKSVEYQLHEYLVQTQEMLSILNYDTALHDRLAKSKELITSKQYTLAVMGEFKRGKSTLINALLGSRILPADATPTTATLNRITYGTKPQVVVNFLDGSDKEIGLDQLPDYVSKAGVNGQAQALQVKEATIYFPTVICQNHIDIFDTPGLNDDERMTEIAIRMVAGADMILIPIHARSPFSETERNFVCQLIRSDRRCDLMFVVTFMDQLDEDDYKYDRFMRFVRQRIQQEVFSHLKKTAPEALEKAHAMLDELPVCGISAETALNAFVSNSQELLEESRFEEFRNLLLRTLTAKQTAAAARKTVGQLQSVLRQFDEQDISRRAVLQEALLAVADQEAACIRYQSTVRRMPDMYFAQSYDEVQGQIQSLNKCKNQMVQEFIRGLSRIRENTHEAIFAAMREAAASCENMMQMNLSFAINRIKATFQLVRVEMEAAEGSVFTDFLPFPEEHLLSSAVSRAALSETENLQWSKVGFAWPQPYVPQAVNLAQCDVIETAIAAVDAAVSACVAQLDDAVAAVRAAHLGHYRAYFTRVEALCEQWLRQQQKSADAQMKAYDQNYKTLSVQAQQISLACDGLLDTVE